MERRSSTGKRRTYEESDEEYGESLGDYCFCGGTESEDMVQCDLCDRWYHLECLGMSQEEAEDAPSWQCDDCEAKQKKKKQASIKRTPSRGTTTPYYQGPPLQLPRIDSILHSKTAPPMQSQYARTQMPSYPATAMPYSQPQSVAAQSTYRGYPSTATAQTLPRTEQTISPEKIMSPIYQQPKVAVAQPSSYVQQAQIPKPSSQIVQPPPLMPTAIPTPQSVPQVQVQSMPQSQVVQPPPLMPTPVPQPQTVKPPPLLPTPVPQVQPQIVQPPPLMPTAVPTPQSVPQPQQVPSSSSTASVQSQPATSTPKLDATTPSASSSSSSSSASSTVATPSSDGALKGEKLPEITTQSIVLEKANGAQNAAAATPEPNPQ